MTQAMTKKKGRMTMLRESTFARSRPLGLGLSLLLAGCGAESPKPKAKTAGDENDQVIGGGGEESTGLGSGAGKVNPEQIMPKAKKREISDDQRADFDKAMARYLSAKKSGGLSGGECTSVADAFKSAADGTPVLLEALFNQGAVLQECGREEDAVRIWQGMSEGKTKYGPAMTNLGYIAWKNGEPGRAEGAVRARDRGRPAAHRRGAQQSGADPARQGAPRELVRREEAVRRPGGQPPAHRAGARQQQPAGLRDAGVHLLRDEHAGDGQAGRQSGHQEGGRDRDRQVRGGEGRGGRRGQGRGKGKKKEKKKDSGKDSGDDDGKLAKEVDVREVGTGVTASMKINLAVVHNTLGLVELKRKNISPAITQFRKAVDMNPAFNEARLNLAALSLNNRDYKTAEENFRAVLQAQPKNYEASIGLGVALRGGKKIEEAETQYNDAQKLDPSNPSSYFNLGLLYQDYKDGQKPTLQKAQSLLPAVPVPRQRVDARAGCRRTPQKRIKDIDEIYVALEEAAKMQAEAEEMQRKAEEQQKQMEEQMKKQEADDAAAAAAAKNKAAAPAPGEGAAPAGGEAPKDGAKDQAKPEGGAAAPPADDAGAEAARREEEKGQEVVRPPNFLGTEGAIDCLQVCSRDRLTQCRTRPRKTRT